MSIRSRITRALGLHPTPVRPNHIYRDTITGEQMTVTSVSRRVHIVRHDAIESNEHRVHIDTFRQALDAGIVEHVGENT